MPDAIYTRFQSTAKRLIEKYGQTGTVTRMAPPDPVEGGEPVATPYPAKLVSMQYDSREIDGTVIQAGDVKLYISSVGLRIVPGPGDYVTAGGKQYRVVNSDPQNYDGVTNVVHIVQGRIA